MACTVGRARVHRRSGRRSRPHARLARGRRRADAGEPRGLGARGTRHVLSGREDRARRGDGGRLRRREVAPFAAPCTGRRRARLPVFRRACGRARSRDLPRIGGPLRRPDARDLPRRDLRVRHSYRLDGPEHAPVLVLPSSLGTSMELWSGCAERWTASSRVLRYDARGHGGSEVPPGPYTMADFGGDLIELLDELAIERASLCGSSLGGAIVMQVASTAPERVERLVLACTAA